MDMRFFTSNLFTNCNCNCSPYTQASRLFQCQAKSRDETALLIVLASETEVELDEVR
jgi:hypothetical protein